MKKLTEPTATEALANPYEQYGYSREQVELIKTNIAKGASDNELTVFLLTCKRVGLDPWSRQIYLIPRWDKVAGREVRTPQFSIDGFRAIAARTSEHGGTDDAIFDSEASPEPNKASVTVYRVVQGVRHPFTATARWSEYAQTYKDQKTGEDKLSPMWKKMPYLMLAKCAESQALRKAFPQELSGLYTVDEMAQATPVHTPPVPTGTGVDPMDTVSNQTIFDIELKLETAKPDPEVLKEYLRKNFGTADIHFLTEANAKIFLGMLEAKYPDKT